MDRAQVLATLRKHEAELRASGILSLSLFGSTARGQAGPDSDVDLLATFDSSRRISILDVAGMQIGLSEMLGCNVDLIEEGKLKPRVQARVLAETVRAF